MKESNIFKLLNLGRQSYLPTLSLQKSLQEQLLKNQTNNHVLILVEHNPVYTAGLRETISEEEETRLIKTGAEFIKTDRGGLTTFHGPGQLVAYPILHLKNLYPRITLKNYVSLLENTAVHTCRMLGLPARLSTEGVAHTGAWVNDAKICAVGVHCRGHVTTHGLALNNSVDLKWYENIVPCGIKDKGVTSIKKELGYEIPTEIVTAQFLQSFQSMFRCALEPFDRETLHKYQSNNTANIS